MNGEIMFWEIIDRADNAELTVEGVYLRSFEPDAETEKRISAEAAEWVLSKKTVELNRHICYNHLTDYGWTHEIPIRELILKDGRFFGVLIRGEDEFEFGRGIRKVPFFGILTTEGASLGKTFSEFLYSASEYGRSSETEYELSRKRRIETGK